METFFIPVWSFYIFAKKNLDITSVWVSLSIQSTMAKERAKIFNVDDPPNETLTSSIEFVQEASLAIANQGTLLLLLIHDVVAQVVWQ